VITNEDLTILSNSIVKGCREISWKLTTAESCTGGIISAAITSVSGSSKIFDQGFIVYSDEAKSTSLEISSDLINIHGAVSSAIAKEMALAALKKTNADISIAVTGIAGPEGGTKEKPVGLIYLAIGVKNQIEKIIELRLSGTRDQIRLETAKISLEQCLESISNNA